MSTTTEMFLVIGLAYGVGCISARLLSRASFGRPTDDYSKMYKTSEVRGKAPTQDVSRVLGHLPESSWSGGPMSKPPIAWTLVQLYKIWCRHPDLRLGQLVCCAVPPYSEMDLFNMRDEELIQKLLEVVK